MKVYSYEDNADAAEIARDALEKVWKELHQKAGLTPMELLESAIKVAATWWDDDGAAPCPQSSAGQ